MSTQSTSATRLIRQYLSSNSHLSTQQIFTLGTANERPILQPTHEYMQDGRVRMKKVSNMREGRRPWVPAPVARFPDHPFKSVNFLKSNILASLESQHLVHKAAIERPIESAEEEEAVVRQAAKETRRLERKAQKLGLPTPPAREPKRTVTYYAWKLGPPQFSTALPQSVSEAGPSRIEMEKQWERAENLELAYHANREMEEIAIEQRRTARRERFKVERERMKAQRAEDERMGRMDDIKREKERKDALAKIRAYAEETGEDVSGWYEELGEIIRPKMDDETRSIEHRAVDIEEELGIPTVWKGEGVFGLRGKGVAEGISKGESLERNATGAPRQTDGSFSDYGFNPARPFTDRRIRTLSGFGMNDTTANDGETDRSSDTSSHIAGFGSRNRLTDSERPPWLDRAPPGYSPRPRTDTDRQTPSFSPRTPRGGSDGFRPQPPSSGRKGFGLRP